MVQKLWPRLFFPHRQTNAHSHFHFGDIKRFKLQHHYSGEAQKIFTFSSWCHLRRLVPLLECICGYAEGMTNGQTEMNRYASAHLMPFVKR